MKYLKPNVVIEPLIDQWYAWSNLLYPPSAAMNITGRHLKIISSFIMAPQIHAAAVKNPKMLGGPFMDIEESKLEEVKALREKTLEQRKQMIQLSEALHELDKMLQTEAKGFSLHPLYEKVPDMLKGYVELFYDLNHHASYRFFEKLMYQDFYDPSSESIAIWITENDERPFVLSTPRLESDDVIHLNIPFSHVGIDQLASMRRNPGDPLQLAELLGIPDETMPLFMDLFTEEKHRVYDKYTGDKIRMRYFGHACILIETNEVSILVDPLISYYGYLQEVNRFSDADLPDHIDYVLITHNHQDHVLFETLLPLRHKIGKVVVPRSNGGTLQDPSLKLIFHAAGFHNVIELDEMEELDLGDIKLTGLPFLGEHADLNVRSKLCYHVNVSDMSLIFVADSCNIEPRMYQNVHKVIGDVDVIFLGMECDGAPLTWLYGPLLTAEISRSADQSRRLSGSDFEAGKALIETFNPTEVYVYAMGMEPWLEFISSIKYTDESRPIVQSNYLVEHCKSIGITAERLYGEKEILYDRYAKLATS